MITKPSKLITVFKHMLVYSYVVSKDSDEIVMNQESFADFLKISRRSVIRHFNTARELGLIELIGKKHVFNNKKRTVWMTNIYHVDISRLNQYILLQTGEDCLENIEHEIHIYYDFMNYVREACELRKISTFTEEEKEVYLEKKEKSRSKKAESLSVCRKKNEKFVRILEEVNNTIFPLQYLQNNKKRLVNVLCATRNPEHSGDQNRIRLLKKFFQTDEDIVEFDTNASIYRLSYALGHKETAPNQDIYKLIFDECHFNIPWTSDFRNKFKKTLMPIYMREGSIKYRSNAYKRRKLWKRILSKEERDEQLFYSNLEMLLHMSIYDILDTIRKAMHAVFNLTHFYKGEIFIYESNLHILMLQKFKELGIKTINVYDGFYFKKNTMSQELYDSVYTQAVHQLLA